jgi:plasmid maintenance system killer protein
LIVDILFKSKKLAKECSDSTAMKRRWGASQAAKLRQRLDDLRAAPCLGTMRHLPGRCHELVGDRAGQIYLDLVHPYRLIFEPAEGVRPLTTGGGLDWSRVRTIRILAVEDYHG